jgi:hypothetical protein
LPDFRAKIASGRLLDAICRRRIVHRWRSSIDDVLLCGLGNPTTLPARQTHVGLSVVGPSGDQLRGRHSGDGEVQLVLHDLEKGHRVFPCGVGAVVRLGREAGVATPLNRFIYSCLLPQERRSRAGGS